MRIQLLVQSEDAGDAADVVGEVLVFVGGEGAAEEGGLAVAEPLLEDLVAAEGVVPDGLAFHCFVGPSDLLVSTGGTPPLG